MANLNWNIDVGGTNIHNPGAGWTLVSVNSGSLQWRRESVDSPFVAGRVLVNATPDVQTRQLGVRVRGSSLVNFQARWLALLGVFLATKDYTVTITCDGVQLDQWTHCEPPDWDMTSPGSSDGWSKFGIAMPNPEQEYLFSIPSAPSVA